MAKPELSSKKGDRAGLPGEVIFKDYPLNDHVTGELDDTIARVDREKEEMVRSTNKKLSNQH